MAQITYRANLTAAEFPLLSELQGRSVIITQYDHNYHRFVNSGANADQDAGIPQIYYGHNIIPTDSGVGSVGYLPVLSAPADGDNTFSDIFALRDTNDNKAHLAITASGRNYIQLAGANTWLRTTDIAPATSDKLVTTSYVNGVTYIYYGGNKCKKYNWGTNALDDQALTGLTAASVLGICAANGYNIAWTKDTVTWSSVVDPTDFTPSLVTGAGGGNVREIKGNITCCLPCDGGFVVWTKENAVLAKYTGNGQYPFVFDEVKNSGGLATPSFAAYDANSAGQYVYTTNGLQKAAGKLAQIEFPHVTDFLAGSQFEDFNETTYAFAVTQLGSPMQKKFVLISNRYLVISYGITSLTHAMVYDIALGRWGKLKLDHVDCFEYIPPNPNVVETPRRSIGFLQQDGSVKVAMLSYDTTGSNGVLILGKYQLERNGMTAMQEIHLENIKAGANLDVRLLTSINGKTTTTSEPALAENSSTYRRYNTRKTGLNHSLVFKGAFHMTCLVLKLATAGGTR